MQFVAIETNVAKKALSAADRLLLEALVQDGRQSHRELAERTGMSAATVNRRVNRLEASGVLQGTSARIHAESVGWGLTVIIGLRIQKGHLRQVQEQIATDPRVFGVYDVTGEWDGIVLARCQDRPDLDELAKTTLSSDFITRSNTMVVLKTVHEDAIVRPPV